LETPGNALAKLLASIRSSLAESGFDKKMFEGGIAFLACQSAEQVGRRLRAYFPLEKGPGAAVISQSRAMNPRIKEKDGVFTIVMRWDG